MVSCFLWVGHFSAGLLVLFTLLLFLADDDNIFQWRWHFFPQFLVFLMVVIKTWDTSIPKQQLWLGWWLRLDVSHASMAAVILVSLCLWGQSSTWLHPLHCNSGNSWWLGWMFSMVALLSSTWFCPAIFGSTYSVPPMKLLCKQLYLTISLRPHTFLSAYDAKQKQLRQSYSNMPEFSSSTAVNDKSEAWYDIDQEEQD